MMNYDNKRKVELVEIIKNKEDEILELKEELRLLEKCKKYEDITDEIDDVYEKLKNKGFDHAESLELVHTMMSSGLIPAKTQYPYRGGYVHYR